MNRIARCFGVVLVVVGMCSVSFVAAAERWPRFRGPNGQGAGSGEGIPVAWSGEDIAWELDLDGRGNSSPVIWDDTIFVTVASGGETVGTLLAVDAASGTELWQRAYSVRPQRALNELNSIASSTPALDETGVYTIWFGADETLVVGTGHDGAELWKRQFAPAVINHGPGASPITYDGKVIFSLEQDDGSVEFQSQWYALDVKTGKTVWELRRENSSHPSSSTPCIYKSTGGGDVLVFASRRHGVTAVSPDTGKVAWEAGGPLPARVVASPVVSEGGIVAVCGKGGGGIQLSMIQAPAGNARLGKVVYTISEKYISNVPTPVSSGEWLFIFHDQGVVTCLDSRTGALVWSERPAGKFLGSPIVVGDRLYGVDTKGQVVVLRAGGTYEKLAVNDIGEASYASPAAADGRLVIRTFSKLVCVTAAG